MEPRHLETHPLALVVHGGAGEFAQASHRDCVDGCRRAAAAGWEVLTEGGTALDAVETAVRVLENDASFDAGRGAFLNACGEVELDAMIMDGHTLNLGAVMAVKHVRNPIVLARLVMKESEHNVLVAQGAEAFALNRGLSLCPNADLIVPRELERYERSRAAGPTAQSTRPVAGDTVGALALDASGHLAAATSTGGTPGKHPGRVGDSPLVGSGAYADDCVGAAAATGEGEQLMKVLISKSTCDYIYGGMSAQEAADAAIELLARRTAGLGGIIVLDPQGGIGISHNTRYLAHATVGASGTIAAGMSPEDVTST